MRTVRENAESKGRRYLAEGRVTIAHAGPDGIRATVRGNGEFYEVAYERGDWSCTCPAVGRCAHLVALMLVTVRPGVRGEVPWQTAST